MLKPFLLRLCRCYAVSYRGDERLPDDHASAEFIDQQLQRQPWWRATGLRLLLSVWGLWCAVRYPGDAALRAHLGRARRGRVFPLRLLAKFIQSLVLLRLFAGQEPAAAPLARRPARVPSRAEVVVVGSGPAGAVVATYLAERGINTVLLEEGGWQSDRLAYGWREMLEGMRWGGIDLIPGRPPLVTLEGCAVGGASEVNSALYLRAPASILAGWQQTLGCGLGLTEHYAALETELGLDLAAADGSPLSTRLAQGASRLGWQWQTLGRLQRSAVPLSLRSDYRSMATTLLPRFEAAGGVLCSAARVENIRRWDDRWLVSCDGAEGESLSAAAVVLAAGAYQTPRLLRRSKLGGPHVGRGLHSSVVLKIVAEFEQPVNDTGGAIGAVQVREFAPRLTLGCAVSHRAQLAQALAVYPGPQALLDRWRHMGVFSVILSPQSRGEVTAGSVRYPLAESDWQALAEGVNALARLLAASGARALYPVAELAPMLAPTHLPIVSGQELRQWQPQLLMLHPTASCHMAASAAEGVVDSQGRVFTAPDLWVCDASSLPGYPGANPQATVMAMARRQAAGILHQLRG
ncbi:FAD-dependent oxidoreductase [Motiliproteus sediminis]|uniref:FAD-dependent oxidoreductase n=1 Tax=Motiliproteus sediminis TaxID=1468178 RepID=UPI001AEF3769|nr:FAD-dependent oxidoreductase [Motiliproteus sediminis]